MYLVSFIFENQLINLLIKKIKETNQMKISIDAENH